MLCDICIFGAEQHISKRHSALAVLTRPDKAPKEKKNTRDQKHWRGARVDICNRPVFVWQPHCRPKVNDIGKVVYYEGIIFEGTNEGLTSSHISTGAQLIT